MSTSRLADLARRRVLVAAFVTLGLTLGLGWLASHLPRYTIIDFELARTASAADEILKVWDEGGRQWARRSIYLDFLFIPSYVAFLAGLLLVEIRRAEDPSPLWVRVANGLAGALVLAGLLDVAENVLLLHSLSHWSSVVPAVVFGAFVAAAGKFLIVIAAVFFVILAWSEKPHGWQLPLWQWLFSYPILIFVAVALVLICWSVLARSFGIPDLFWHEEPWMQVWSGLGVGLLLLDLGFAGFLLDSDGNTKRPWSFSYLQSPLQGPRARLRPNDASPVPDRPRTAAVLWGLAPLGSRTTPSGIAVWPLPLVSLLVLVTVPLVTVRVDRRFGITADVGGGRMRAAPEAVQRQIARVADPGLRQLHKLAYYYFLLRLLVFLALWALYLLLDRDVSTALAICLILGTAAAAYGFVRYYFFGQSFGIVSLVVVAILAINSMGGNEVADLDYGHKARLEPPQVLTVEEAGLLDSKEVLEKWKSRHGKRPLFVVAADGGGIRAAVWTMTVLRQLENDIPGFPYHLRLITGASGGMLGAGFYVASLADDGSEEWKNAGHRERHLDAGGRDLSRECLIGWTGRDGLGAVARQLVFGDLFSPPALFPKSNRAHALDMAWRSNTRPWSDGKRPKRTYDGVVQMEFSALRAGEREGWRPSLVLSPMIVEDGRRLLISNLSLERLASISMPTTDPHCTLQGVEFFRIFKDASRLRLSTAIQLNAAFPFVSPPLELPTSPPRHVLDAGFYDEHGVDPALAWLWMHRAWIEKNTSGVALIQIPDSRSLRRRGSLDPKPLDWWQRGAAEVIGPPEALHSGWSSGQNFRDDQLLRVEADAVTVPERENFFRTFVFEPDVGTLQQSRLEKWLPALFPGKEGELEQDVALSWRLTTAELERLSSSFYPTPSTVLVSAGATGQRNCDRRRQLQDWWSARRADYAPDVTPIDCGADKAPDLDTCEADERSR